MHDDSNRRTETHGETEERQITSDGSAATDPFGRRPFLQGLTGAGVGTGLLRGGTGTTTADSAPSNRTRWTPAEVPFNMATPWYDQVSTETVHREYPRPQLVRDDWQNLNGVWEFTSASVGESPPTGLELDEEILVPFPPESALSGIRRHESRMWYRTTFSIPKKWLIPTAHPGKGLKNNPDSQRLLLNFERVDWRATVYVNGKKATTHEGGYDSFSVDVTEYLNADGEQELVVKAFDPTQHGTQPVGKQETVDDEDIFFTPTSGIWDTVWIEPVRDAHIDSLDITPQVEEETLALTVDAPEGTSVKATASNGDGTVGQITGPANERLSLSVPDPHLWSPDDPFLYDLEVELRRSGGDERASGSHGSKVLDSVRSYFGMRSVGKKSIRGVIRPTLNGEFVFHNGIYDQGYWPDGIYTPPTDEARQFDLRLAKDLGFNAYRKHIKIPSKRWYYWADKLGFLVWQDIPNQPLGQPVKNEKAQEQFRSELRDVITQNDNHPSIAVWIPVNEGWGHGKTNYDRIRSTTRFVKDIDDKRLIDSLSGIDTMFVDGEIDGDMIDYHNYGTVTPLPESTETQMSVVGESSAGWTPIDGHVWGEGQPPGNTPEVLVENLIRRAENNERYMTEDGFSGAINLQTTDTEFHYQGVVTYDRKVFKPDLVSENAAERVREANTALIEASKGIDQRPYLTIDAPPSYGLSEESFNVASTITNPKREEDGSFGATDVKIDITDLPSGLVAETQTPTEFDVLTEGSSETVRWGVSPEGGEDPDPGIYTFTAEATFATDEGMTTVAETGEFEIEPAEPRHVGFWPFDAGNGETAADEVGDHDGTLVGDPEWVDGRVGSALRFDGSDDYVDTNAAVLDTSNDYSIAAWVKLDSASGFQTAVSQVMGNGSAFFLQYLSTEQRFSFSFMGGRAVGGPTVEPGSWYHVVGVHDTYEERAELYVDGERVAAIDRAPYTSSGDLLVGRATYGGNPVDFWNGSIDQAHVYQSSLAEEEVQDLYESGR